MKKINLILGIVSVLLLVVFTDCSKEPLTSIQSFDEIKVSFDNIGKGETAIIFIHGWSNNRTIWDAQVSHFSDKYQVIAVDLPGFGESENERNEWTMENFGKDIAEIIRQLKLDDVVVVGFSMGAPVAIEAARQMPDNIAGVVLVDNLQNIEMKVPAPMMHFVDSMMMDLINHPTKKKLVGGGFFKHNIAESTEKVMQMLDGTSKIGWQESLAGYMDWSNNSSTKSIEAVKAPIIAINSDNQPTNIEALQRYSPSFKAHIVKDVGHVIMWDKPKVFNRLLEESIQEFND